MCLSGLASNFKVAVNKIRLTHLIIKLFLQTTSSLVFSVWVGVVNTRQLL